MAKLGTYSYPDIRFEDAVEIAGKILSQLYGSATVQTLAVLLGMAENSGTLFAKIAALRDFGLVDGRGEVRITDLARNILAATSKEDLRKSSIPSFQRVELLRVLYDRFEGEAPDDTTLLVALEEITKAPREEIVRRFTLIQRHLADVARAMKKPSFVQDRQTAPDGSQALREVRVSSELVVRAGEISFVAPLTPAVINAAIELLRLIKEGLENEAPVGRQEA